MSIKTKFIVVTTINPPSHALKEYLKLNDWQLIIVGDNKTPNDWNIPTTKYISPSMQSKDYPKLSESIGWNKYARKNLGYLEAIKSRSEVIAEIDDDIAPYPNYPPPIEKIKTIPLLSGAKFVNIYNFFGGKKSWPRGYPINQINTETKTLIEFKEVYSPIQNSLLDQDGDFDAIYRLISNKQIEFVQNGEYALDRGVYCPFHSGNTFWYPEAYPLLYMPAYVNPHVEDIWRGYIAQRLVWEINGRLTFIHPTVYTSDRNPHDYLKDFKAELPIFLETNKMIEVLDNLTLSKDLYDSMIKTYQALIKEGIMVPEELKSLTLWLKEVEKYSQ